MPLSMVTKETKEMVKKSGYSILTWALRVLIAQGQYNLAASIIVSLCLAPRRTELENNGVLSVLRNFKLRENRSNVELMKTIERTTEASDHYDKIGATLVATRWWRKNEFYPRFKNPSIAIENDRMLHNFGAGKKLYCEDVLCDFCCCKRAEHFQHFRLILPFERGGVVRIIGKQMGALNQNNMAKATSQPNGYSEYKVNSSTILSGVNEDLDGRSLMEILKPGVWYNFNFQPDTELNLVDDSPNAWKILKQFIPDLPDSTTQ